MKKFGKKGNGGFTLLEVILSIAILGMIAVPLMKYFTDSLRYASLTGRQQRATLLAQETLETLKAQDKLIRRLADDAGNLYYWVPDLAGSDENDTTGDYTLKSDVADFDKDKGMTATGKPMQLFKEATVDGIDYEVLLSISTDVDANTVERPVIYGVDDTKNVMIVERDEEADAILYFMEKNTSYIMTNTVATPIPGAATPEPDGEADPPVPVVTPTPRPHVDLLENENKVREYMTREINITIGKEEGLNGYYTVKANYVYKCSHVTDQEFDECPAKSLMDTRIRDLKSVYLLFNMVNPAKDVINLKWDTTIPAREDLAPEFVFICQDLDRLQGSSAEATPTPIPEGETPPTGDTPITFTATEYHLAVGLTGFDAWPTTANTPMIRTNIVNTDPSKNKGTIVEKTADTALQNVTALTTTGAAVRIVELNVAVYKKGDYDEGKEPLVEMKTTKSE